MPLKKETPLQHSKGCGAAFEFSLSQQCEITLSLCVLTSVCTNVHAPVCACVCAHLKKIGTLVGTLSLDKQSEAASLMLMS